MKLNRTSKIILIACAALVVVCVAAVIVLYSAKTVNTSQKEIFIYPNTSYSEVVDSLKKEGVIKNSSTFDLYSSALSYKGHVREGRYVAEPKESILSLVRRLRNGSQTPVKISVNNCRTLEDFAEKVSKNLMISDSAVINAVNAMHLKYPTMIFYDVVPDTYEVYWNISAVKLLSVLKDYADKFYADNAANLKKSGLSRKQAVVLASIVNEETNKADEKARIAGVYVNRLHKNMLLQADPTVKFAVGDFSIKRIKGEHLSVDSPFNTYKTPGLPPAPICLPEKSSLMAAINYERHSFIYFCAKEDFSGYHNFAADAQQHILNARKYRNALNQRGIK